ncbi:MAG: DUF2066 domain-containing protein [Pseudomonadota bacterium]
MLRFARAALLAVSATVLSAAGALAGDVFAVAGVKVRTEATDATTAKREALALARREAMDILLRRLTPESEWDYLPLLAEGEPAPAAGPVDPETSPLSAAYLDSLVLSETGVTEALNAQAKRPVSLTDQEIAELEAGLAVSDEKSSSRTYAATVTMTFSPTAIRDLLRDAGLPYSETQTRNALVLPVLQTQNGLYLWESNNPWFAAWRARPLGNELTPMVTPLGELEDVSKVSARNALSLDQERLAEMATRYGVTQVVIAHAKLEQFEGQDRLQVRLVNGYRVSAALAPAEEEELRTDEFGLPTQPVLGGAFDATAPEDPASDVGELLAEGWYRAPTGDFPTLARTAIEAVLADYAEDWKQATLIDHLTARVLQISAHFQELSDWIAIRRALDETPFVETVQVLALSPSGALLSARVVGEVEKLGTAMEERGLSLWSTDADVGWNIADPEYAPVVRSRLRNASRRRYGAAESQRPREEPRVMLTGSGGEQR